MKKTNLKLITSTTLISLLNLGLPVFPVQAANLNLGSGEGSTGGTVTIPIN